jgi:hypothetical protein
MTHPINTHFIKSSGILFLNLIHRGKDIRIEIRITI